MIAHIWDGPVTRRRRRAESGITLVELLVSAMILMIGLMGITSLWAVTETITIGTDEIAIAYNLGRQALEQTKIAGFANAAEGTRTAYYDGNQQTAASGSAKFAVVTSVVSSAVSSGTAGTAGAVPAAGALRTVVVTVKRGTTSTVLHVTNTYLSGHGI